MIADFYALLGKARLAVARRAFLLFAKNLRKSALDYVKYTKIKKGVKKITKALDKGEEG